MRFSSFLKPCFPIVLFCVSTTLLAQKKMLDHSVYDDWKSLQNITISDDGNFISAIISPQEGDSLLFIHNLKKNQELTLKGINKQTLSPDGKYTVGLIKAPFSERREARIKKKKADEMPEDSLAIIHNNSFHIEKIAAV